MPIEIDIILVKTSSLGDVLHNLPVVTDILAHVPGAQIDWVVEESFAALPALHPGVRSVIPVAVRRWRNDWWAARGEVRAALAELRGRYYDCALDTQGLLKSALITRCIRGERCGYDWRSAREPLASLFYRHTYRVAPNVHAVERNRRLAATALGYTPDGAADYGIRAPDIALPWLPDGPCVVLLHATSRADKQWEEKNWVVLGGALHRAGLRAVLPWGSEPEKVRSERLCAAIPDALCPPRLGIAEAAALLGRARAAVGVDTGLSHLAAALGIPTIGLYVSTDPGLTGLHAGPQAVNLGHRNAAPTPDDVLETLADLGVHA